MEQSKGFLKAKNWRGSYPFAFNRTPEECPQCGQGISHKNAITARIQGCNFPQDDAKVLFQCFNEACLLVFLVRYKNESENVFAPVYPIFYHESPHVDLEAATGDLSPEFLRVYAQAAAALRDHRPDVAGPGFRKAFEILVKDYIALKQAADPSFKRDEPLIKSVRRIEDPGIREFAIRVTWLGNDFTHTDRRWPKHDVSDLEGIVLSFAYTLVLSNIASHLIQNMPE